MSHDPHPHRLLRARLQELRPTQITVGEGEVRSKRREWSALPKRGRKIMIEQHVFPAVIGPKKLSYIVDHHHLGLALLREGEDSVWISVLDDLSWLDRSTFWRVMEFRMWTHPYNARGERCDYRRMPTTLEELEDDPFRTLAGLARDAGGFAKSPAPFAEFLWADFFRVRIGRKQLVGNRRALLRAALELAQSGEARYLPGWSGKTPLPTASHATT